MNEFTRRKFLRFTGGIVGAVGASTAIALPGITYAQNHDHDGNDLVLHQINEDLAALVNVTQRTPVPGSAVLRRYEATHRLLRAYVEQSRLDRTIAARARSANRDAFRDALIDRNRVTTMLAAHGVTVTDFPPDFTTPQSRDRAFDEATSAGVTPLLGRHLKAVSKAAAGAERKGAQVVDRARILRINGGDECWEGWHRLIEEMEALATLICITGPEDPLCIALWISIVMDYIIMDLVCGFGWG